MTWNIFLGIVAIIGFVATVCAPIIKLNTSITKLNCTIDILNGTTSEILKRVDDHEKRLTVLEIVK